MNKSSLILLLLLSGALTLNAQQKSAAPSEAIHPAKAQQTGETSPTNDFDQEARKSTEILTAKYKLTADQAKQLYTIQVRKQKNLAQIASLQTSEPALYRAKVHNVQTGTLSSLRNILQSKEQVVLYQKTQSEIRVLRNKKQKELNASKASKEDIETALLDLYAE